MLIIDVIRKMMPVMVTDVWQPLTRCPNSMPMSQSHPGVGVIEPISSVPLFSEFFSIIKTHVTYWISRLYLTGDAAAQLWWHLSKINVIWINKRYFCKNENFAYGEINERSFSNPHPWSLSHTSTHPTNLHLWNHNKANLMDLIAATSLVVLLKSVPKHQFFGPCHLEIWQMISRDNRPHL